MRLYHHLTHGERRVIQKKLYRRICFNEIARSLERAASTISREVRRNKTRGYQCDEAHAYARQRRPSRKRKLDCDGVIRLIVSTCLMERWSPEQISAVLTTIGDASLRISHEGIYQWLYGQKGTRCPLCDYLRRMRGKRQKRDGMYKKRIIIEGKKSIHTRPASAENRTEIGHWEADLVQSKGSDSYLVTAVDRVMKYLIMAKIPSKESETTIRGFTEAFADIPNSHIRSITIDNGSEFTKFTALEELFECDVYFADPYSAWQRGLNENTNGLIRQYLPKSTSFKNLTDDDVEYIKCSINNRPRKTLQFRSPEELFSVALET